MNSIYNLVAFLKNKILGDKMWWNLFDDLKSSLGRNRGNGYLAEIKEFHEKQKRDIIALENLIKKERASVSQVIRYIELKSITVETDIPDFCSKIILQGYFFLEYRNIIASRSSSGVILTHIFKHLTKDHLPGFEKVLNDYRSNNGFINTYAFFQEIPLSSFSDPLVPIEIKKIVLCNKMSYLDFSQEKYLIVLTSFLDDLIRGEILDGSLIHNLNKKDFISNMKGLYTTRISNDLRTRIRMSVISLITSSEFVANNPTSSFLDFALLFVAEGEILPPDFCKNVLATIKKSTNKDYPYYRDLFRNMYLKSEDPLHKLSYLLLE